MIPVGTLCYIVSAVWNGFPTRRDLVGRVGIVREHTVPCSCEGLLGIADLELADGMRVCVKAWAALRPITPPAVPVSTPQHESAEA